MTFTRALLVERRGRSQRERVRGSAGGMEGAGDSQLQQLPCAPRSWPGHQSQGATASWGSDMTAASGGFPSPRCPGELSKRVPLGLRHSCADTERQSDCLRRPSRVVMGPDAGLAAGTPFCCLPGGSGDGDPQPSLATPQARGPGATARGVGMGVHGEGLGVGPGTAARWHFPRVEGPRCTVLPGSTCPASQLSLDSRMTLSEITLPT